MIANTLAISFVFKRVLELFDSIHEPGYYIHWFTDEGELDAARTSISEFLEDYKKCGIVMYDDIWGGQFWELLCTEHGLDQTGTFRGSNADVQLQRISTFFREVRGMRYVPRSVLIDLDKDSMEGIKSSPYSSIFRQDNFIYGQGGTGNNWAKGHLTEGVQLKELVLDITRREAENTDCLQAFQLIHSIGGGTGSGLGALIMDNLKDEYPGRNVSSFTIIPSPGDPKSGVEIYNAVLTISHLVVHCDETYLVDNFALHRICSDVPKLSNYTLEDLNHVISSALSGITTCMRFKGQSNTDFRKIAVNFVPYPRMHFFAPALAPLVARGDVKYRAPTVSELFHNLFLAKKMFVDCDVKYGKYLTVVTFFRGNVCMKEVINRLEELQNKNSAKFVDWVPDSAKTFVYDLPPNIVNVSGTMISNTTAIRQVFKRLKDQFNSMFRRKAFLAPFKTEGMEEMEFEEAASNLNDLIDEYKQSQVATADNDKRLNSNTELQ